ncbi:MAG: hypothetical protein HQM10_03735 [Candidatus Riflebacteria bacterium]|nr:hypothetical protein [Candidatus Riflebacteria bacterium]
MEIKQCPDSENYLRIARNTHSIPTTFILKSDAEKVLKILEVLKESSVSSSKHILYATSEMIGLQSESFLRDLRSSDLLLLISSALTDALELKKSVNEQK